MPAASPPARNWFDLHRLLDQALLEAVSRGESTVNAAAATAAISRVSGRLEAVTEPVEQAGATVDDALTELEKTAVS